MDLNAAVDVLIRLIPDRKMVNKDYQLWSYPEPPEDVLDLDRKWPTSPEQLAWCDSRRKRDWKEISYEEYMKWPWYVVVEFSLNSLIYPSDMTGGSKSFLRERNIQEHRRYWWPI